MPVPVEARTAEIAINHLSKATLEIIAQADPDLVGHIVLEEIKAVLGARDSGHPGRMGHIGTPHSIFETPEKRANILKIIYSNSKSLKSA
jgi:hypothetical protein